MPAPEGPPSATTDSEAAELAEGPDEFIREDRPVVISADLYGAVQAVIAAYSQGSRNSQQRYALVAVTKGGSAHDPTAKLRRSPIVPTTLPVRVHGLGPVDGGR